MFSRYKKLKSTITDSVLYKTVGLSHDILFLVNKHDLVPALLEKFFRISLYLTDDAIAKLCVT